MNINELAAAAHLNAVSKGFYSPPSEFGTRIALIHSEVSEALEAHRNGNRAKSDTYEGGDDDYFKTHYEANIKGSVEEEMADIVIRVMDMSASMQIDLESHIIAKMRYNSMRPHKHGGKAY